MIRDLKARGHKGISELKLMDLDHINIICGKDNSGKTSILEALMTYVASCCEFMKFAKVSTYRTTNGVRLDRLLKNSFKKYSF